MGVPVVLEEQLEQFFTEIESSTPESISEIERPLRQNDPALLQFLEQIGSEVIRFYAYVLLYRAAKGKLPVVDNEVKTQTMWEYHGIVRPHTPEEFKRKIGSKLEQIERENPQFSHFVITAYLANNENPVILEEAVLIYALLERQMAKTP